MVWCQILSEGCILIPHHISWVGVTVCGIVSPSVWYIVSENIGVNNVVSVFFFSFSLSMLMASTRNQFQNCYLGFGHNWLNFCIVEISCLRGFVIGWFVFSKWDWALVISAFNDLYFCTKFVLAFTSSLINWLFILQENNLHFKESLSRHVICS